MEKGKIIVLEGASDGIGKSTQSDLLEERLQRDGEIVIKHHFPTYNKIQGELLTKYLKGEFGPIKNQSPYIINSLFAIDRAITWNYELKKEYEKGKTLLFDRYTTSSIIYQGASIEDIEKRKEFIDYIIDYEYDKLGIPEPDNVLFLHAPFDVITKLRESRTVNEGVVNDIHERDIEFLKKVYDNAMFVADYLNWDMINCSKNNEMLPIDEIHQKVYSKLKK